ncbi:MAG TPA: ABC transporter permease [Caulobacterales bacterium]|nr:ABC transporter permease [Caulobacterales bacterium]
MSDVAFDTAAARAEAAHHEVTHIRPDRGWLDLDLAAVWRYRELLLVLIMRDIQVLYKQAALGAAWAILQPLFAVVIFTVIFGYFVKMPSDGIPYPIFAFAAVLPWTYFAEATRRSATGMVDDAELVRKVYFPRLIMPLAKVCGPLLDFSIAFVVLLIMMLCYGIMPSWKMIVVPPLVILAGLLALSVGLWLGPINVRFRDIKHTVPFMLQIGMYAAPIVYPLSRVPEEWRTLYSLNPMVGVIDGFRWAVFGRGELNLEAIGLSCIVILVLLAGGLVFFRRMERSFADVI